MATHLQPHARSNNPPPGTKILTFSCDNPQCRILPSDASADPTEQHKIMHSQLETPDGLVLMGADTPEGMEYRAQAGVSVSLSGDDEARLRGYWERLSDGGSVMMPFEKAPWGDMYGMCVDRFGTSWMVNVAAQST